jgi:hypothetical protein
MFHTFPGETGEAVKARGPKHRGVNKDIPLSEMTSRMFASCLCDVDGQR